MQATRYEVKTTSGTSLSTDLTHRCEADKRAAAWVRTGQYKAEEVVVVEKTVELPDKKHRKGPRNYQPSEYEKRMAYLKTGWSEEGECQ
jgi:hypothetical protein